MSKRSMFFRLLTRGLLGRGNRPAIAFIALVVAATMITAMLNLYYGLENKLTRDFRSYGANITMAAADNQTLPEDAAERAQHLLSSDSLIVPVAFAIAHTVAGDPVVVAGTDIAKVQRLNSWWLVSNWPKDRNDALVGANAAATVRAVNGSFALEFSNRKIQLHQAGTLKTGADEENRVYMPLAAFQHWTAVGPSLIEIYVPGSRNDVSAAIARLDAAFPDDQVRPVRQLLEAQGAVIGRMRSVMLASTLLIAFVVAICVLSTLTSSILERRRDFAVMKAIGSSQRTLNALFAGETLTIAIAAGVVGYALGCGIAAWISEVNFHAPVQPQLAVLPLVILCSMAIALLATVLPLTRLQRIEPAGILKGE
jgi:putative ABC transport system permease protein